MRETHRGTRTGSPPPPHGSAPAPAKETAREVIARWPVVRAEDRRQAARRREHRRALARTLCELANHPTYAADAASGSRRYWALREARQRCPSANVIDATVHASGIRL